MEKTDSEVSKAHIANPRVKQVMKMRRAGLGPRRSVYMVTGIKIAKGLAIETEVGGDHALSVEVGVDATAISGGTVRVGAGLAGSRSTGDQELAAIEELVGDRIFAYQLCRLRYAGFEENRLQAELVRKGAFCSLEDQGVGPVDTGDLDVLENLGSSDLEDDIDDEVDIHVTDVADGKEDYRCITIKGMP